MRRRQDPTLSAPAFALCWALILGLGLWADHHDKPQASARQAPSRAPVPCGTDADCARLNPGMSGSYAFPEKRRMP